MPRALRRAILIWATGNPIPTDLAMQLAALGFDVERLEMKHMR